jgi:hypothetical protein
MMIILIRAREIECGASCVLAWPSGDMAGPEAKAVGATSISFALLAATLLPVQGEVTYWDTMLMWGTISSEYLRPTRDRKQA